MGDINPLNLIVVIVIIYSYRSLYGLFVFRESILTGPKGETGVAGSKGDQGIQGQVGTEGPKGEEGPKGQKGEPVSKKKRRRK